jgi:hypothetical protein
MNSEIKTTWALPGLKGNSDAVKQSILDADIPQAFKAAICESIPPDAKAVEVHAHAILTDKRFQMHMDIRRLF